VEVLVVVVDVLCEPLVGGGLVSLTAPAATSTSVSSGGTM
jgi:hypothetical protein